MLRQTKWAIALGLTAFWLATLTTGGLLMAREVQEHSTGHTGAEAKMAKAEHVEPESEAKINPLEIKPALAVWTLVVFLLLLYVLGRYAWKPI